MSKQKKRDDDKEFDLVAFKRKHFAHFAFKGHVLDCDCDPKHPDGCPFKANFGSKDASEGQ